MSLLDHYGNIPTSRLLEDSPASRLALLALTHNLTGLTSMESLLMSTGKLRSYLEGKRTNTSDSIPASTSGFNTEETDSMKKYNDITKNAITAEDIEESYKKIDNISMMEIFKVPNPKFYLDKDQSNNVPQYVDYIPKKYITDILNLIHEDNSVLINTSDYLNISISIALYFFTKLITIDRNKEQAGKICFVFPNISESISFFNKMKEGFTQDISYGVIKRFNNNHIELENGSIIDFMTVNTFIELERPNYHNVVVFGASRISHKLDIELEASIEPFLKCQKLVMISQPGVKNGIFYNLFTKSYPDYGVKLVNVPYTVEPKGSFIREKIEKMRPEMSEIEFKNKFECRFIDKK